MRAVSSAEEKLASEAVWRLSAERVSCAGCGGSGWDRDREGPCPACRGSGFEDGECPCGCNGNDAECRYSW